MCSCMRTAMDVSNEASSEVEPSDVASFAVGDTFSSYDNLKKKLAEFEKSHSVQLTQIPRRCSHFCVQLVWCYGILRLQFVTLPPYSKFILVCAQ